MALIGMAFKFGRDINTDYILASKHRSKTIDMKLLSVHLMEDIRPGFSSEIGNGGFIVADENFGCGSSREYAPKVILAAGIKAIIAKSFARIFFRNAINLGLFVIEADTTKIDEGDELEVDLDKGEVRNITSNETIGISPLPAAMQRILEYGGLVEFLKERKSWD